MAMTLVQQRQHTALGLQRLRFGDAWLRQRLKRFHTLQPDLFKPRPLTRKMRRFIVIGDAGSGTQMQAAIAKQLKKYYQTTPFATVLVLGDNVYDHGKPQLFANRIYQPYHTLFQKGVKFFPVLGNNDVAKGHGAKQLDYWGSPNYYNFKIADVEFFALDTTLFVPGYDGCYANNIALAQKKAEIELQWLEKSLKESHAKIKVVYGHYPVYSSSVHGEFLPYYTEFRKRLEPILSAHQVDLYLSGHNHLYERSEPIKGVQYIVSGAAGKLAHDFPEVSPHPRKAVVLKNHFMSFKIRKDGRLSYESIDSGGHVIDSGMITPKNLDKSLTVACLSGLFGMVLRAKSWLLERLKSKVTQNA